MPDATGPAAASVRSGLAVAFHLHPHGHDTAHEGRAVTDAEVAAEQLAPELAAAGLALGCWRYQAARRWPRPMRIFLLSRVEKALDGAAVKVDLAARYICRLLRHLDAHGLGAATPRDREGCRLDESVFGALSSGYVARASRRMPHQGRKAPWRMTHHFPTDRTALLQEPIDDGVLEFEPQTSEAAAVTSPSSSPPREPAAHWCPGS